MALLKQKSWKHLASAAASVVALSGVVAFVGCSGSSSDTPTPPPQTKTIYEGTLYMASTSGGHIAVVPVTIDPTNAAAPITVDLAKLDRIQLKGFGAEAGFGAGNTTHNFHDVRLDGRKLYYSAIKVDSTGTANDGMVHLGWVDLDNPAAEHDAVLDAAPEVTGMVYCGSGQTDTHFVPMTMSHPAYIDAISKSDLADNGATLASGSGATDVKRTLIEQFRGDSDYIFAHGVNSPNQEQLFVAVNDTNAGEGGTPGGMSGSVTGYLLNMSHVVAGTVDDQSVMATNTITGLAEAGTTIAFRSTFTPDSTKILQAGKDRLLVLNAADLTLDHQNTTIGGSYKAVENHDVMPTPDGKYAILALRFKYSDSATAKVDSGLQLYDLTNHAAIGNPVSACNACHRPSDPTADTKDRATCGLDGSLTAKTVSK